MASVQKSISKSKTISRWTWLFISTLFSVAIFLSVLSLTLLAKTKWQEDPKEWERLMNEDALCIGLFWTLFVLTIILFAVSVCTWLIVFFNSTLIIFSKNDFLSKFLSLLLLVVIGIVGAFICISLLVNYGYVKASSLNFNTRFFKALNFLTIFSPFIILFINFLLKKRLRAIRDN